METWEHRRPLCTEVRRWGQSSLQRLNWSRREEIPRSWQRRIQNRSRSPLPRHIKLLHWLLTALFTTIRLLFLPINVIPHSDHTPSLYSKSLTPYIYTSSPSSLASHTFSHFALQLGSASICCCFPILPALKFLMKTEFFRKAFL